MTHLQGALIFGLTAAIYSVCLALYWRFSEREIGRLRKAIERQKRNEAKRGYNDLAMRGWSSLMAGHCPDCCGSGIQLTIEASELDSDDIYLDEPDWDVGDCSFCGGSGLLTTKRRERMLKLLRDMCGKKLRTPLDASLNVALREAEEE